jgi:endogenous inhibitor of DNA gyrase (YacG/DUF329 family)
MTQLETLLIEYKDKKYKDRIPVVCEQCGKETTQSKANLIISKRRGQIKLFCSQRCFHDHNITRLEVSCFNCSKQFHRVPSQTKSGIFCSTSCAASYNNKLRPKKEKVVKIKAEKDPLKGKRDHVTKLELFGKSESGGTNWQRARSVITKHAQRIASVCHKTDSCFNCGYSKHVEVCHIQAVMSFPDSATLKEINAPDNLVGLCPNCHWEFDHGQLVLKKLDTWVCKNQANEIVKAI